MSTNLFLSGTYVTSHRPRLTSFLTCSSTGRLLHYRTSTLISGFNGRLGDHVHITDMMHRKNLQLINASELKNCYTLFMDEEQYGQSFRVTVDKKDEVLADFMPAIQAQLIVPQAIGDLILMRQNNLLQSLNIIIEDILDSASSTRSEMKRTEKPADVMTAALAGLSFHALPKKTALSTRSPL